MVYNFPGKYEKTRRNLNILSLYISLWTRSRTFFRTVYPTKNTWLPTLSVEYCEFKLFDLIHTPGLLGLVNRSDNEIVQISIILFWLNLVTKYALFIIWVIPNMDFSVQCVQTKSTWLPTLSEEHCAFKLLDLIHTPGLLGLVNRSDNEIVQISIILFWLNLVT